MKNVTERKGLLYFRRKVAGKDTYLRLPAIDHPDFGTECERLSSPDAVRAGPDRKTLAWLVQDYRGSAEWKAKSLKTRENQGRYLQLIVDQHGHRTTAGVRPVSVYRMREAFADTPGKANVWRSVFGSMMRHAIRIAFVTTTRPPKSRS